MAKVCTTCGHGATKKPAAKKPKEPVRASVLAAAVLQRHYKRKVKKR